MKKARLLLWGALALIAAVVLVRTFFFGVYYVDSPSMEPVLHGALEGGDSALVSYGRADHVERFEVVVILPEGENEPLVKRVAALPGEKVQVRDGNLWIDGEILRSDWPLVHPVLIFDEELHDLTHDFRMVPSWTRIASGWKVDVREVNRGAMAGCLYMALGIKDHYLLPSGERVPGRDGVGDALLECSVETEPGFVVHLGLVEQGDVFELLIDTTKPGRAAVRLLRNREEQASEDLAWAAVTHDLRFANFNNRLTFELDGERVLTVDYESNQLFPMDTAKIGLSPPTDRIFLGGHAGVAVFSGIRVFRDLHYTPRGKYAVEEPLDLGPGEMFLLGDNSRESSDGRDWGPTPLSAVIGRPLGVVWPLGRMRRIPVPGGGE